jgi:hypothetical protein
MPDGQHFLMVRPEPEVVTPPEVVVIPTVFDEIAARESSHYSGETLITLRFRGS